MNVAIYDRYNYCKRTNATKNDFVIIDVREDDELEGGYLSWTLS